jgi:hypothetical protein
MSKVLEQTELTLAVAYYHLGRSLSDLWGDVGKDQDKFSSEVAGTLSITELSEAEEIRDSYRMFEGVDPPDERADMFTPLWRLWCEIGFESPWYDCPDDI